MKSAAILFFALMFIAHNSFAQALPKKPSRSEVGAYNQANLLKVDLGLVRLKCWKQWVEFKKYRHMSPPVL